MENYYKASISFSKFDEVNSMQIIFIGPVDAVFTVNSKNGSFISVLLTIMTPTTLNGSIIRNSESILLLIHNKYLLVMVKYQFICFSF